MATLTEDVFLDRQTRRLPFHILHNKMTHELLFLVEVDVFFLIYVLTVHVDNEFTLRQSTTDTK